MTATTVVASYNGWTNYETWAVNLWLNSKPYSYDMLQHIVTAFDTASEQAAELEYMITSDDNYLGGESSMWADLLHAAIGRVNWREIVEQNAEEDDYAHCASCDCVINLDKEAFTVVDDSTYCALCR